MKNAKAYVALAGSIATALLGVFTADSAVGKVLTVVAVVATAFSTWAVPNAKPADERGQADVVLMLVVATFVGVVLLLFNVKFGR